jgi:hypothetical protein
MVFFKILGHFKFQTNKIVGRKYLFEKNSDKQKKVAIISATWITDVIVGGLINRCNGVQCIKVSRE